MCSCKFDLLCFLRQSNIMSIKIIVDNNFFDNYECYPDDKIKQQLIANFINKYFSFYPCTVLVAELLGIWRTKRKDLLSKYSSIFFKMIDYRVLNDWNRIIRIELGLIKGETIFLEQKFVVKIRNVLKDLSQGIEPDYISELLDKVNLDKQKMYKVYKDNQEYYFNRLKVKKLKNPNISFEDFYKMDFAIKIRKDLVKNIFSRADVPVLEEKIDKILDSPTKYPYFHTSLRIFIGLYYLHLIKKGRVGEGDNYDQYYLIYLTGLDYLVSNDGKLKELAEVVFGRSKKVINFAELVELIPK